MNKWIIAAGVAFLYLGSALPAQAQTVDLKADWPKGECLKKASPAETARFKITGPGRLEVHLYLDPYRHAGRAAFVPLLWTRYLPSGKQSKGWGVMGDALAGQGYPDHFFQGGKEVGNWREGVPWEMVSTFDVTQGEYDIGVMIITPAVHYGCGYSQWQQKARLVITFSPKGSSSSKQKPSVSPSTTAAESAAGASIAGTWTMQAAGYANTLEIIPGGGGYSVRWLTSSAPAETIKDFHFDSATGTVEFVRPLKAKGYPDQMFKGKLEGGKLSGEFGFAPNMGAKAGWSAVRKN